MLSEKHEYQEIGEPTPKVEDGSAEKEEDKQSETSKLKPDEEETQKEQMPDFIQQEAKKADVAFYVVQMLACIAAGGFAAYSGHMASESSCSHPVAMWLLITGVTIFSIGLLWWLALLTIKCGKHRAWIKVLANKIATGFLLVATLFFLIWWIMGHIWIFQSSRNDCDEALYLTGLWFIIGSYIYLVFTICMQCWVAMCLVCCAVFRPINNKEEPASSDQPANEQQPLVVESQDNIQDTQQS